MSKFGDFCMKVWPPLPVWQRLDLSIFATAIYSLAVAILFHLAEWKLANWLGNMGVVNGILLGVLLGFRNREAYERWWEARKLWGQLINDSRNFAMKVVAYVNPDTVTRSRFGNLLAGFAIALKNHLRGTKPPESIVIGGKLVLSHMPIYLASQIFEMLQKWRTEDKITDIGQLMLDTHARSLMDICGACERIKSTPVPMSYTSLLRHGTILYLLTAPWFLAGDYGYWSIAVVCLLAYFLLGTEFTAEDVEEPFGRDEDDLQLTKYCETIVRSVQDILEVSLSVEVTVKSA